MTLDPTAVDLALAWAHRMARSYLRRWPDGRDEGAFYGEAAAAVAVALSTWNPTGGADFPTWAHYHAWRALRHEARRQFPQSFGRTPRPSFLSLDAPVSDENEAPIVDVFLGSPGPEEAACVRELVSALGEPGRSVIKWRFWDGLTQAECGARLGLSQVHAGRLEQQALSRLREAWRAP